MKICIINSFYYPDIIGGAEVSVKHLAEKMVSKDNEISILCTGFKEEVKEINKVKVYMKYYLYLIKVLLHSIKI